CANYVKGGATPSWPNAIRFINGRDIDGALLSKGLSLVTRLPVYLTGDFNTSSDVTNANSLPWVSTLVAGDKVALVSNGWNDQLSRWDQGSGANVRNAADTTYNTAMLSDPATNLTLLLEDWSGNKLNYNGSLVFGYSRVFALHGNWCCGD